MWLWFWDMNIIVPNQLAGLTKKKLPNTKIILFTDDVHSKREQQLAELHREGHKYNYYKRKSVKIRKIELSCYSESDAVVAISQADALEIIAIDPTQESKVKVVTFVHSPWDTPEDVGDSKNNWRQRKDLVFVGNGMNPTNVQAIKWYMANVAHELDKGIPGVKFNIIGPSWGPVQSQLKTSSIFFDQLVFLGQLSTVEMNKVIDACKVFVSPVIASTGINTKNVLALSLGIPLVTTPAGIANTFSAKLLR